MALPLSARYPDRPLPEDESPKPQIVAQRFAAPDLAIGRSPIRRIHLPDPTAGASFANVTVPSRNIWYVERIHFRLATDANVASRIPHVRFLGAGAGAGTQFHQWLPSQAQVAGLTIDYAGPFELGAGYDIDSSRQLLGLVMRLLPGEVINFTTTGIQVGDQFSRGFLSVEQIPVPEGEG